MATAYTSWLPDIAPHVPGCPNVLIAHEIKRAAQDFFRHTRAWQVIESAVAVSADTQTVTVTPADSGQELVEILSVKYDDNVLTHIAAETLDCRFGDDWEDDTGTPNYYTMLQAGVIRLYPIPSAAATTGIVTRNVVCPSEASTSLPDNIALEYRDAIQMGARARLMMYPNKPWTNVEMGAAYGQAFARMKDKFNAKAAKNHGRARILTRHNWC